jgi:hypothetical protein
MLTAPSRGCTNDDEPDGYAGIDLRHEGDAHIWYEWWSDGCDRCGIH